MFTRYTNTEKTEVLSLKEHQAISSELHKTGSKSVSDLTQQQKEELAQKVAQS